MKAVNSNIRDMLSSLKGKYRRIATRRRGEAGMLRQAQAAQEEVGGGGRRVFHETLQV